MLVTKYVKKSFMINAAVCTIGGTRYDLHRAGTGCACSRWRSYSYKRLSLITRIEVDQAKPILAQNKPGPSRSAPAGEPVPPAYFASLAASAATRFS